MRQAAVFHFSTQESFRKWIPKTFLLHPSEAKADAATRHDQRIVVSVPAKEKHAYLYISYSVNKKLMTNAQDTQRSSSSKEPPPHPQDEQKVEAVIGLIKKKNLHEDQKIDPKRKGMKHEE